MPLLSEKLSSHLTVDILSKLKEHGIKSVAHLLSVPADRVSKQTGIPYNEVETIQHSLRCQFSVLPVSGCDLLQQTIHIKPLPTGCTSLNELLNGGLVRGQLTEVCGAPGAGKTQFCLCVTSEVVMATGSSVAYVDGGCGFSSGRLKEMLQRSHYQDKAVKLLMERVRVSQVFSVFELLSMISTLKENVAEQVDCFHSNLHLLVVDPVTLFISPHLGGHQTHGHALMNQVAMAMKVLAHEQSIAVLLTNNVVADRTAGRQQYKEEVFKPAMGLTWSHIPSTRIMLSHARPSLANHNDSENKRVATLVKSTRQAVGKSIVFGITENGLE